MKRRKFLEYGALGSAAFIANLSMLTHQSSGMAASGYNKRHYDWILLYWMPYDNDLSGFGQPILHMLIKGVQSDNILVAVESDFSGTRNLSRRVITKGKVDIQQLKTVNSAREDAFAEYLNWAQSQFVADNWAIIFLGHGGRLDQVSPDNHAGLGNQIQWMNIQKLRDVVAQFNQNINDRVELFFFQNCNKGTIEAHYTLHDVAEYTLSSQKLLGAPNHYYESLLQFLSYSPEVNGGELAEKIIQFERSDMYNSYTVTNNRIMPELPVKLNPLLEEIIAAKIKTLPTNQLKSYSYMGERYVDFVY
ncbi:MAG: clostripain family protease, partial [Symploca sp. SIO1A3]|nr:clostripain family protease [Symploca sp. SIO1A3]